jgi:phenol hydroxylase P0 protein
MIKRDPPRQVQESGHLRDFPYLSVPPLSGTFLVSGTGYPHTGKNAMAAEDFDPRRKFVRVVELRADGFVEFDFAIGEPELFVELIMPAAAFDEFCASNKVSFVDTQQRLKVNSGEGDAAEWNWSLRDATHQRFKSDQG